MAEELTLEQQQALALANARMRAAQQQPQPQGGALQTLKDATQGVTQGVSGNWSDELFSYGMAPFGMLKKAIVGGDENKSLGQRFTDNQQDALAFNRKTQKDAAANSPIANTVGQITGGVMTAGKLASGGATLLNVAKPTVGNLALRGAAEGAIYGGIYGAGEGEGLDDKAAKATWGMGTGLVTGGLTGAVTGKLLQNAANKTIPTADAIKAQSQAAYKVADDAKLVLHPQGFSNTVDDIMAETHKLGINKKLHPAATEALAELKKMQGHPVPLQKAETLRRILKGAANSKDAHEQKLVQTMIEKLDNYVGGITTRDVITSVSADTEGAVKSLQEARKLWATQSKSNRVAEALENAGNRVSVTGSGGNTDNVIRQEILKILKDPRGYSKAEQEAMQRVVDGTTTQNILRKVGKISPDGNGLSMMLNLGAAGATSGASLPITAVGVGAKMLADRGTQTNVRILDQLIRSGGNMPSAKALSPAQRMIIDSLLANQNTVSNQVRQQLPVR